MQDELQKMEEVARRTGVSYQEARLALREARGDVAEAVVIAERDRDTAGADLAAAGLAFMDELKGLISGGEMRALRIRFGDRLVKEFSISPRTALTVLGVAAVAILITKLTIEVERVPQPEYEAE